MPRLSTKVTVKLEPDLLTNLQSVAESGGQTVSGCVREAVIRYLREQRTDGGPGVIRLTLTRFEREVVDTLLDRGVVDTPQELYHRALETYISEGVLRPIRSLEALRRLRPLPNRPSEDPAQPMKNPFDIVEEEEGGDDDN